VGCAECRPSILRCTLIFLNLWGTLYFLFKQASSWICVVYTGYTGNNAGISDICNSGKEKIWRCWYLQCNRKLKQFHSHFCARTPSVANGHSYKQFTPRYVGKLCSSAAQKQKRKSYSSSGRCTCSSCSQCPRIFESEFPRPMERKRLIPHLQIIFSRAMWKINYTGKGWIRWMKTKPRSLHQLQMSQRTLYSASGKWWTIGWMYAGLKLALSVKCFAYSNISTCM
jgi:hypothetical protein